MELPHNTQGQQWFYYCGPAAVRVALTCRGLTPSQVEIADELVGIIGDGQSTPVYGTDSSNDIASALNSYLGAGTYGVRFIPGQDATPDEVTILRGDLVAGVDAGFALVANVVGTIQPIDGGSYSYPNGHYVAVVGYRSSGSEALVADVAVGRDYWVTTARLATWIAERGYSYPLVAVAASPAGGIAPGSEGVDYSFARPSPAGLVAAGIRFAGRYIGPGSGKLLDADELAALTAAGLSVFLLAEGASDSAAGGYPVGQAHAAAARAHARALGIPDHRPAYYAVDYDITEANWPSAREYLRGACDVDGVARVGVYGDVQALEWARRDGVASWFFQTLSASSWSQGRVFDGNHVEQYRNGVQLAGGEVDLCRARQADFGQWPTGHSALSTEEDDDMTKLIAPQEGWGQGGVFKLFPTDLGMALEPLDRALDDAVAVWGREINVKDALALGTPLAQLRASAGGGAAGISGPVDLTPAAVAAVADATADELAADPERDGRDK